MTNFERIKTMSVYEMAQLLNNEEVLIEPCNKKYCPHFEDGTGNCTVDKSVECQKATERWLESEVEVNE